MKVLGRKAPFSPAEVFPEVAFGLENLGYPERELENKLSINPSYRQQKWRIVVYSQL
ncbi:hypothetical protein TDIS_1862 [Thermosulfurimonas dismutans]|uniref:Uncharacterized protein n=1 Tax=Thermosulfurimonas dismutans TaxID=999894 RepID=A0A179D224_9BACT|nr:hypothetical protein TDIS_1862 [Thermosulfurimonas dismutans]